MVIAALIAASSVTKAQTNPLAPQAPKDTDLVIKIKGSQLMKLRAVLYFSYDALNTSRSPSVDVQDTRAAIQEVFPALVPDTTKVKPVPAKPATSK